MDDHGHVERRGDRIDRNIVMRRANAAGREAVVIAGAHRIDRLDDLGLNVGDHAHLGQADPLHVQP